MTKAKITVNAQGVKQVLEMSGAVARDFAETMAAAAAELSPYLTGHNKSSIKALTHEQFAAHGGSGARDGYYYVVTESGYGAYLELGTSRMPARPYFAPAFERARREFKV